MTCGGSSKLVRILPQASWGDNVLSVACSAVFVGKIRAMNIREATPSDQGEIIALYKRSQQATGLPDPVVVPPEQLGARLYARQAIGRYVAISAGRIEGHGLIEHPNPEHLEEWREASENKNAQFIELGGAFVDPAKFGRGVWSSLLEYRLDRARDLGAVPVSVTWASNDHVMRGFECLGGGEISRKTTAMGAVSLYIFE